MRNGQNGKPPYRYITLINAAWETIPYQKGYKGAYMTVFLALVDSINRNRWVEPVSVDLETILKKTGVCRKVYTDARAWLESNGLILFEPGKGGSVKASFSIGLYPHEWASEP